MTMEAWLTDAKGRMSELLEELWTHNQSKFSTRDQQRHRVSMARFVGIPIELFAVLCATEIEKYKSNLDAYISKLEETLNPARIQLEYPLDWKLRMDGLLRRIVQIVEYVPHPVT